MVADVASKAAPMAAIALPGVVLEAASKRSDRRCPAVAAFPASALTVGDAILDNRVLLGEGGGGGGG